MDTASQAERDAAAALDEDCVTAELRSGLGDARQPASAIVSANQECVLAGCAWFAACMRLAAGRLDLPEMRIDWLIDEGQWVAAGGTIVRLAASVPALLAGERSALNFLGLLSATATRARRISEAAAPVPVYDTRKTVPLLRAAQKHAAGLGGMKANRASLAAGVLVKDNQIRAAGSVVAAYQQARQAAAAEQIQIEVESIEQLTEALAAGAKRIMLDNFPLPRLAQAVELAAGQAELEASGGIDESNAADYAKSGVDRISVGAATKEVGCIDLSLKILPPESVD